MNVQKNLVLEIFRPEKVKEGLPEVFASLYFSFCNCFVKGAGKHNESLFIYSFRQRRV